MDIERRKVFSWQDTIDNQPFTMGLSKPYQTIRRNAPNERCFWVEVPLESETAVMIMGIDLLKND